jgi:hypothetical protein
MRLTCEVGTVRRCECRKLWQWKAVCEAQGERSCAQSPCPSRSDRDACAAKAGLDPSSALTSMLTATPITPRLGVVLYASVPCFL